MKTINVATTGLLLVAMAFPLASVPVAAAPPPPPCADALPATGGAFGTTLLSCSGTVRWTATRTTPGQTVFVQLFSDVAVASCFMPPNDPMVCSGATWVQGIPTIPATLGSLVYVGGSANTGSTVLTFTP